MDSTNENKSRVKRAELLSGIGAVTLGVGLGVLLSSFLKPHALPVLFVGLAMHALGMFLEHKYEKALTNVRLWWAEVLYWICWLALLGVAAYVAIDYLRK